MTKKAITDVLDMEVVQNRAQMDIEFLKLLISVFNEDAPPSISIIKKAWDSSDNETVHSEGHKLKGMCANVGAKSLKELALKVETVGANNDLANEGHLPELLEATYLETQEHFEDFLKGIS